MLRVNMHAWYISNNPVAQPFHVSAGLQTKISPSQLPAWIPRRHWLEGAWHRSCLGEIDLHFDWNMMIFDCKELLVQTASLASCTMPARQHWQWVQRRFRFQVQTLLKRLPLIWCCCFPSPTNVCKMFVASQVKRSWRRFFPKMVSKRMVRFDGSFLKSRSPWATWKMTRSGCDNCFLPFNFFCSDPASFWQVKETVGFTMASDAEKMIDAKKEQDAEDEYHECLRKRWREDEGMFPDHCSSLPKRLRHVGETTFSFPASASD